MSKSDINRVLSDLDDSSLVSCVQQRKPNWDMAANILLKRHRRDIIRRCRTWLGHPQDAEDATQESLLRAYRAMTGFRADASFRTWLWSITDNNCHRLAKRRAHDVMSSHLRSAIALHEENRLDFPFSDDGIAESVLTVLDRLPTQVREILELRYFQELSFEEIAETLGIGLSAAKMRLYRSLEQFKNCYLNRRAKSARYANSGTFQRMQRP